MKPPFLIERDDPEAHTWPEGHPESEECNFSGLPVNKDTLDFLDAWTCDNCTIWMCDEIKNTIDNYKFLEKEIKNNLQKEL